MLNKNGWGIKTAIAFCAVFVVALLVVVFLITGTVRKMEMSTPDNEYNNSETDNSFDATKYYKDIEANIYDAVKEYVDDNSKLLEKKEYFKLNLDTLVKNGYISNIDDEYGETCSGYIEINNEKEVTYGVFLKCSEYETIGYDEKEAF